MVWYKKYLLAYEKPFHELPKTVIHEIKSKITNLQSNTPLASVVVIAYNEEKYLFANLWSLSDTRCKYPIEIIGIDNASLDHTTEIFETIGIPYYTETQHSGGYARQLGLNLARGKYYICIDSDTLYPSHYVETLINALQKPNVMVVSSSYIFDKQHSRLGIKIYELFRDIYLFFLSIKRPELTVRGAVMAFNTQYGRKIGFRGDIKRGEDGSMTLGLKKYGKIKFIRNQKARAITSCRSIEKDGSLFHSFKIRVTKAIKNIGKLFTKKEKYEDEESNLIK